MKKIFLLFIVAIMLLTIPVTTYAYPPEKIVLYNTDIGGELNFDPRTRVIKVKIDRTLYSEPNESSAVVGVMSKDEVGKIEAYELHTYPRLNQISANEYVITYIGEGYYKVWDNGQVKQIRVDNNRLPRTGETLWLCVRVISNGCTGWLKFDKRANFYSIPGGIFGYPDGNNRWQ